VKQTEQRAGPAGRFGDDWRRVLHAVQRVVAPIGRLIVEMGRTNVSLLASALAFYGLLSIFPALVVVITSFALMADPGYIGWLISGMQGIMPGEAFGLISGELTSLSNSPAPQAGLGLVLGLSLSLWSAHSAAASMIDALNRIYRTREQRSFVVYHVTALGFTVGGLFFGLAALAVVAVIPVFLSFLPVEGAFAGVLTLARWPVLGCFMLVALLVLYRFAPCRRRPHWTRVLIGASVATLLWLVGSGLFSYYVAKFNSYDKTYGSIGAVIVLLMWFYVSAYTALMGALLDADLERRMERRRR
jgi:membrane protein